MSSTTNRRRTKAYPGSIFRRATSNRLYVKYRGRVEATGLPDTRQNRKILESLLIDRARIELGLRPDFLLDEVEQKRLYKNWPQVLGAYAEHLRAQDISSKTRVAYAKIVMEIIGNTTLPVAVDTVEKLAREWCLSVSDRYKATSINIHLRNFRVFTRWLSKNGHVDGAVDVAQYMRKATLATVHVYTDDECQAIVGYFRERDVEIALLIEFLLATGFRINEALKLRWTDVTASEITVPNKVKRNSELFPVTKVIQHILSLIPREPGRDKVFRWRYDSASSLSRRLRDGIRECGIEPRKGWHTFRKTFQDRLYRSGIDMADRQRLMRHANIKTTIDSYTYTSSDRLRNVLEGGNGTSLVDGATAPQGAS